MLLDPDILIRQFPRCCQTNANQSQFARERRISGRAELTPLGKGGGAVGIEDVPAGEAAFLIEVVTDEGVDGSELLEALHAAESKHRPLSSSQWQVRVLDASTDLGFATDGHHCEKPIELKPHKKTGSSFGSKYANWKNFRTEPLDCCRVEIIFTPAYEPAWKFRLVAEPAGREEWLQRMAANFPWACGCCAVAGVLDRLSCARQAGACSRMTA